MSRNGGPPVGGREFPQWNDGEKNLLGGLILDAAQIQEIAALVSAEDFFREAHGKLYRLLLDMVEASGSASVDLVTVTEAIGASRDPQQFGGVSYVSGLPDGVPSTDNLDYYAGRIRELSVRRRLLAAAAEIAEKAHDKTRDLAEVASDVAALVSGALEDAGPVGGSVSLGDAAVEALADVDARAEARRNGTDWTVSTGIAALQEKLGGLWPSDLVILAARPAMGKTAFALHLARAAAWGGRPVLFCSLEMSRKQLALRMVSTSSAVPLTRLRDADLRHGDSDSIYRAQEDFDAVDVQILDSPSMTVEQIRATARRLRRRPQGLSLVIVDYLQLIRSGGGEDNREQEVASMSRALKSLARELEIPVVALSQLNRGLESRNNKRPMMSDLRESGAIEQDADVVLFLYRDEYYNPDTSDRGVVEVIIGKHRQGETGAVRVGWDASTQRFSDDVRPSLPPATPTNGKGHATPRRTWHDRDR